MAVVAPYVFLYLSVYTDPGTVTSANIDHHLAQYPYDFTLFHPGQTCRTCHALKPARSKHCSICKRCIARLDHHCIFINNCVGAGNHHWFIMLLLSTGILTLYGGLLGLSLIASRIAERNPNFVAILWPAWWPFQGPSPSKLPLHQWLILWSWGLSWHVGLGAVSLLAILTTPLVWGLLVYNLWNIWSGVTTNETMKWSDWKYEMEEGYAFRRRMSLDRPKDARFEALWSRWPAETTQIIVHTADGRPPHGGVGPSGMGSDDLPGEGEWEKVWNLADVENLYDMGFWDNLVDVFVPGYQFNGRDTPSAESRGRRRKSGPRKARKNAESVAFSQLANS